MPSQFAVIAGLWLAVLPVMGAAGAGVSPSAPAAVAEARRGRLGLPIRPRRCST